MGIVCVRVYVCVFVNICLQSKCYKTYYSRIFFTFTHRRSCRGCRRRRRRLLSFTLSPHRFGINFPLSTILFLFFSLARTFVLCMSLNSLCVCVCYSFVLSPILSRYLRMCMFILVEFSEGSSFSRSQPNIFRISQHIHTERE